MQTSQEVETAFRAELQALLDKYHAIIKAADHFQGYPECGEDVRMTVEINSIYDGCECRRQYTEIDLGESVWPNTPNPWVEGRRETTTDPKKG